MIHQLELPIIEMLQSFGLKFETFWSAITFLGDETFYLLFMPMVFWCVDALAGFRIGIMLLFSASTNGIFKLIFKSPRPYWVSDKIKAGAFHGSFGLPSGHSQNAAAVWGWTAREINKPWAKWTAGILIFLIGVSRIVLGVHFISDVLLGWLLGAVLVLLFARNLKQLSQTMIKLSLNRKLALTLITTLLFILIPVLITMLSSSWQANPEWIARAEEVDPMNLDGTLTTAGIWFGMLAGFSILLHQKGLLQAQLGSWQKILRYLVGILGVFGLYAGLGSLFPRDLGIVSMLLRFLRYALVGAWITWWSPLLFQKLGIGIISPYLPRQTTAPEEL